MKDTTNSASLSDNMFNLDSRIVRTSDQRIEMVQHKDCPFNVLESVSQFDTDPTVLYAVLNADGYNDNIAKLIYKNKNVDFAAWLIEFKEAESKKLKDIGLNNKVNKVNKDHPMQKTFCSIPWIHAGTNANGSIRACCQMIFKDPVADRGLVTKDDGNLLTYNDKISEHRNATLWKTVRSDMLAGKRSSVCKLCWEEEDASIGTNSATSRRTYANRSFPDTMSLAHDMTEEDGTIDPDNFPIAWWDLRFGNKCNLKCRTCGPSNSDLWYKDHKAIEEDNGKTQIIVDMDGEKAELITNKKGQLEIPIMKSWYEGSQLWSDINTNITDIKRIYFTGGEPTINHKHRELLENIVAAGHSLNVDLEYNTNLAASSKSYFKLWKKFKSVNQGFSLDGMFSHFEYIRHPGKWSKTERILKELDVTPGLDNLSGKVTLTCSVMNVFHLPDFMYWIKEQNYTRLNNEMHIHLVYGPEQYSIHHLPTRLKHDVDELYNRFISHIWKRWPDAKCTTHGMLWCEVTEGALRQVLAQMWSKEPDQKIWTRFKETTIKLDKLRNEDWKESLPDLADAIERMNDAEQRKQRTKLSDHSNKKVKPPKI